MPIHGLYAIIDRSIIEQQDLHKQASDAIDGGATALQYRAKNISMAQQTKDAKLLAALCGQHNIIFIVNDEPRLAKQVGASGVHIGEEDISIKETRAIVGDSMIIGCSCYNDIRRARSAEQNGADYVAFGSFFPSKTKPDAVHAPVSLLTDAKSSIRVPLVAIGGINAINGKQLIAAGADALAVISVLFKTNDVKLAAHHLASLFNLH